MAHHAEKTKGKNGDVVIGDLRLLDGEVRHHGAEADPQQGVEAHHRELQRVVGCRRD